MANQAPTTQVFASPVSTYVQPQAAAVQLYDQQSVNLALQMSEAFSNLSLTAAKVAGQIKSDWNQEDAQKGMDLVNTSRKTYRQLVQEGKISPAENPWMAIGAQKASGVIEGMRARAQFDSIYASRAAQDPQFFDNMDHFDALASNFASNYAASVGDSEYLKSSFFEAFNPYINEMSSRHVQNMIKKRDEKAQISVAAAVAQSIHDFHGGMNVPSDANGGSAVALQRHMDDMIANGYSPDLINQGVVDNLVSVASGSDHPEEALAVLERLRTGPVGSKNRPLLQDSPYAQAALQAAAPRIEERRQRLTNDKNDKFNAWMSQNLQTSVDKNIGAEAFAAAGMEQLKQSGMELSPELKNSRSAYLKQQYEDADRKKKADIAQKQDDVLYTALQAATVANAERSLSPENWRKGTKADLYSLIDRLGYDKEKTAKLKLQVDQTIDSAVDEHIRRTSETTYQGLVATADKAAQTPKPIDYAKTEDQWVAEQRSSFVAQVKSSGLKPTEQDSAIAHFDKAMKDSVEARTQAAFQQSWDSTNTLNERTYGSQLQQFLTIPKDQNGSPIPNAGGDIPDTEVMRQNLGQFMANNGIDPKSATGSRIYRQTYDRLRAMVDTMLPDQAFAPGQNDSPEMVRSKQDARTRKMAVRLQLDSTFGDNETTGTMVRSFQRLLNTNAAEAPSPADLQQAGDIISAFTYLKDNTTFKAALPSGVVGKAFEEEIYYAMRRRASGDDVANIIADIASRKVLGSTYRLNFMDLQNPMNYVNVGVGGVDDKDLYRSEHYALQTELGISNPDAAPFYASKFNSIFMDSLESVGNFKKAVTATKQRIRDEYYVVRGAMIPKKDLPRSVNGTWIEAWLNTNFPTHPDASLVVVGEDPEGKPLMVVDDAQGNRIRVSGVKPILTIQDLLITKDTLGSVFKDNLLKANQRQRPWWAPAPPILAE